MTAKIYWIFENGKNPFNISLDKNRFITDWTYSGRERKIERVIKM